jgi:hypothetical protein
MSYQEKSCGVRPAFILFVGFYLLVAVWLLCSYVSWAARMIYYIHNMFAPLPPGSWELVFRSPVSFWNVFSPIISGSPALLPIIIGVYMLVTLPKMRILLTPQGITIRGWGYRCYAPWNMIRGTTSHLIYEGLLLAQPALSNISLEEGKRRGVAVIKMRWFISLVLGSELDRIFFIPAITGLNWRNSEVGVYIRQYVPRI